MCAGLSPSADICSPALHFFLIVSYFGTYVVRFKWRGIENYICLHYTSLFQHMRQLVLVATAHPFAAHSDMYTISFLFIMNFRHCSSTLLSIFLGLKQKKRMKYVVRCCAFAYNKEYASGQWDPYIDQRGMCLTADISFPDVTIFRFFSHFGRYGACSPVKRYERQFAFSSHLIFLTIVSTCPCGQCSHSCYCTVLHISYRFFLSCIF